MLVKIKKLHPDAVIPHYAHDTDAGLDLTAVEREFDFIRGIATYKTGLAIEIPEGYVGYLFPRSSIYKTCMMLANCVGVVDSGYRGEIMFKYYFGSSEKFKPYDTMERVGQLVIMPYPKIELKEVEELDESDRGENGYGSTGK